MNIKIQIVIESETGKPELVQEVAQLKRGALRVEEFGLTLSEAKSVLQGLQQSMVEQQSAEYLAQQASCVRCGKKRLHKGNHEIVYRTLFGKLHLTSPRLYRCRCQQPTEQTFSPLAELLAERTAPELLYVESKFAALMSYGLTADVLDICCRSAEPFTLPRCGITCMKSPNGWKQNSEKRKYFSSKGASAIGVGCRNRIYRSQWNWMAGSCTPVNRSREAMGGSERLPARA